MLAPGKIPLTVKILYSLFMAILVPFYWYSYGPTNFLYFCDVALFFTWAAVLTEKPLFAAMPAVGILLPQLLWCIDFFGTIFDYPVLGMTAYMFDSKLPLFARLLSFFHFWLPFFLVYLVWRLGYDRRAFLYWTVLAWLLVAVCYLFLPAPPAPEDKPWMPVNVNYVYGMSSTGPQTWMPGWLWLVSLVIALPTLIYLPTHFLLKKCFPPKS
jgi:hypothetical protein